MASKINQVSKKDIRDEALPFIDAGLIWGEFIKRLEQKAHA